MSVIHYISIGFGVGLFQMLVYISKTDMAKETVISYLAALLAILCVCVLIWPLVVIGSAFNFISNYIKP